MAVVTLEKVCKRYPGAQELAVDDVSLQVNDGEFMVLLGPSGCGKSTTLRMVAGLEAISSGTLTIDDQEMNLVPAKDRDIAMVFQSYALYPHMSVYNNLAFGLRRRGVERAEIKRRVSVVAGMLGLDPYLGRKPHALSGGQRQRVALGRAIVREPKVFLFDEPLSNLDAALRVSTRAELMKQHRRLGATMIYVTHDQVEAMTMGSRICIMNHGRVVQIGSPMAVYRHPADTFVARFLGNPPMNLIAGVLGLDEHGFRASAGDIAISLPGHDRALLEQHAGAPAIIGIRPEDLYETVPPHVANQAAVLGATVTGLEPLGAETLAQVRLDGCEAETIARLGRESRLQVGEHTELFVDLGAVHLFDPQTTRLVSASSIPQPQTRHER